MGDPVPEINGAQKGRHDRIAGTETADPVVQDRPKAAVYLPYSERVSRWTRLACQEQADGSQVWSAGSVLSGTNERLPRIIHRDENKDRQTVSRPEEMAERAERNGIPGSRGARMGGG